MAKIRILAILSILAMVVFGGDTRKKRNMDDEVKMWNVQMFDKYNFPTNFYDNDVWLFVECGYYGDDIDGVDFVDERGRKMRTGKISHEDFGISIRELQIGSYYCAAGDKRSKEKLEIFYKMCSNNCIDCAFDKDGKCPNANDFCIQTEANSKFKCGSIFNETSCANKADGRFCPSDSFYICADPDQYTKTHAKFVAAEYQGEDSCGLEGDPQMRLIRGNKNETLLYDDTSFLDKGDTINISIPSGWIGTTVKWNINGLNGKPIDSGTATCDEYGMCSIKIDDAKFSNHSRAKFHATIEQGGKTIVLQHRFVFHFKPIESFHAVYNESDKMIRFNNATSLNGSAHAPFKVNALFLKKQDSAKQVLRFDSSNDWMQKWNEEGSPNNSPLSFQYELCGYSVRGRECMNKTDGNFNLVVQSADGQLQRSGSSTSGGPENYLIMACLAAVIMLANKATPEQRTRVNSRVKEDRRRMIEERNSVRGRQSSNTRQRDQSYSRQETAQSNRTAVSQPGRKYWRRSDHKQRDSAQSMRYRD